MPFRRHSDQSLSMLFCAVVLAAMALGSKAGLAAPPPDYSVGILPFEDSSGSDYGSQLTAVLGKRLQADLLNDTKLLPRILKLPDDESSDNGVDVPTAAQLGRKSRADLVVIGTLLMADVEENDNSFNGPSIGGVSLSGSSKSQDATVVLQVDLVDVNRGAKLASLRATGKDHEGKISPDVSTDYGSMDMGGADFQGTALGKATQRAVETLVRDVEHSAEGFTPAPPPAAPAPPPAPPETEQPAAPSEPGQPAAPSGAAPESPQAGACRVHFRVISSALMMPLENYSIKVNGVDHTSEIQDGTLTLHHPSGQLRLEVSIKNPPQGVTVLPDYSGQVTPVCGNSTQVLVLEIGGNGQGQFQWWQ